MPTLGYALSSEEHGPTALIDYAARAEAAGFEFASISDHYHPWIPRQGESPFVWSALGGIARETDSLRVGTGVTCPFQRYHPAVVAQAAATTAAMFDGRFYLGLGTGENLNEHVTGERWPTYGERVRRLEESVDAIRSLWTGEEVTRHGEHVTVENAKLFTLPEEPPPLHLAAAGDASARRAGEIGDGLIATAPNGDLVDAYREAGGEGPRIGMALVCVAEDERRARAVAHEWWPNAAMGLYALELPTPTHFQQAAELVDEDDVAEAVVTDPDPQAHVEKIREFEDAGFDHVYVHQIGPDQAAFFERYEADVLPSF